MREKSVQLLVDDRARARTKPLLAVLATRLGIVRSRTDALRSYDVDGLKTLIDGKIARIAGGEPSIVMESDGSAWMALANPMPPDPRWEARVKRVVDRECADDVENEIAQVRKNAHRF